MARLPSEANPKDRKSFFRARDRSQYKKIILFIDDKVPEHDKHAGGSTIYQYVRLFCDMGFKVIYLPDNLYPLEPYTSELQQLGVEVLYGSINIKRMVDKKWEIFGLRLAGQARYSYKYIDLFKTLTHSKLLYFTHDLHYLREHRRYELDPDPKHLLESKRLKNLEFKLFAAVDVILTPSNYEESIIKKNFPDKKVFTIPLYFFEFPHENIKIRADFGDREGILFLGGFGHLPNVDAVLWFVKEIFPRVKKQIPGVTFTVAGSNPTPEILALQNKDLRVTGYVPELSPLFEISRVFVAPLRFGAGVKGKIITSLVHGVPVVTTSIGNEGLNLADAQEALIADDPEAFAAKTVELYKNGILWDKVAKNAEDYLKCHFSVEKAKQLMQDIFRFK